MNRFTIALLCASIVGTSYANDDYTYNYDKSVSSISKLRDLSKKVYNTVNYEYGAEHKNEASLTSSTSGDAGQSITDAISSMEPLINDIPGAGFIMHNIWPANSDMQQIMEQLKDIKDELDQMHEEMTMAYKDTMYALDYLTECEQLLEEEDHIFNAWYNFYVWMKAVNDGDSQSACDLMLQKFSDDCDDNRCDRAATYLLNALDIRGSFPSTQCDILDFMYQSSGVAGYEGYANYIAKKSSVMLLEAGMAAIMETVHLIAKGASEEDALDATQRKFGSWMVSAAGNIQDKVDKAVDNADETRERNEKAAKTRIMNSTTNRQTIADHLMVTMKDIYPWNHWAVAVANPDGTDARFDYFCEDDAISCTYDNSRNHQEVVIAQVDGKTKAPISSYENQSHWDWFVNDDNMGTNYITYQFRTMGCGGGTIASSYFLDFMGYAYDDEDMFHLEKGDYQMILGWATHECRCDWPCNGVPDAPFTQ